ncbi:MAG: hypothetical protein V5A74_05685, partial [Desulfohalobiaceae bacterium]
TSTLFKASAIGGFWITGTLFSCARERILCARWSVPWALEGHSDMGGVGDDHIRLRYFGHHPLVGHFLLDRLHLFLELRIALGLLILILKCFIGFGSNRRELGKELEEAEAES